MMNRSTIHDQFQHQIGKHDKKPSQNMTDKMKNVNYSSHHELPSF